MSDLGEARRSAYFGKDLVVSDFPVGKRSWGSIGILESEPCRVVLDSGRGSTHSGNIGKKGELV